MRVSQSTASWLGIQSLILAALFEDLLDTARNFREGVFPPQDDFLAQYCC